MFSVYKHTVPNGKIYIGTTSTNPEKRWKNGKGYENNKPFFEDIVKYGWDNISHEILCYCKTKENAFAVEKDMIQKYKSNNAEFGYNVSQGGDGGRTGVGKPVYCVETKMFYKTAKEAGKNTGVNHTHIGGVCRKERITAGGLHWCFADEVDTQKFKAKTRKRNEYTHEIKCVESGDVFCNCCEASEKTGVSRTGILRVCKNERITAGGFHWEFVK